MSVCRLANESSSPFGLEHREKRVIIKKVGLVISPVFIH